MPRHTPRHTTPRNQPSCFSPPSTPLHIVKAYASHLVSYEPSCPRAASAHSRLIATYQKDTFLERPTQAASTIPTNATLSPIIRFAAPHPHCLATARASEPPPTPSTSYLQLYFFAYLPSADAADGLDFVFPDLIACGWLALARSHIFATPCDRKCLATDATLQI